MLQGVSERPRPRVLDGVTIKVVVGTGDEERPLANLYVQVNIDDDLRPFEVFLRLGHSDPREHTLLEALAKTISYTLRIGGSLREIASDLIGVSAYPVPRKGGAILSVADGMGKVFRDVEDGKYNAMLERGRAARGYAAERQPIAATEPPIADAPSAEGGDGWRECP